MKQIVIIHGGDAFNSVQEFRNDLRKVKVTALDFKLKPRKKWRYWMAEELAGDYEVFTPQMPSGDNAKYAEWKIWFERMLKFIKPGAIFIGHSLGGIFLAKYFNEKGDFNSCRGLFLVAAPFNVKGDKDQIADFYFPASLSNLKRMQSKIYLYHSKDDSNVRFSSFNKFAKALPKAHQRIFTDKNHFITETFPELLEEVKSL